MSALYRSLGRLASTSVRPLMRHYSSPAVIVPTMKNEPLLSFAPGSSERESFKKTLAGLQDHVEEIPCVVGGKRFYTGNVKRREVPYDIQRTAATYHLADKELIEEAIKCSLKARQEWERTPFEHRAAVFLKLADLISTKYRNDMLATTMIGQGKTIFQAEIDATCELIDFYRYAVQAAMELYQLQPPLQPTGVWNRMEHRGLEGFIAAITPFNFTAIGGNLSATPNLMGNVSLWKPSDAAILSNWHIFKLYEEAGIPDGVVNFLPADGPLFGNTVTSSPDLAALSFTGSAKTFKVLWKQIGQNIETYKTFPRMVGECGGKNYHLVHTSADIETVINGSVRSAFEYSGQKCSAASRMYVPESLWPEIRDGMIEAVKQMKVGSPEDFTSFTSCVIDEAAFTKISGYLDYAKQCNDVSILIGGGADKSRGYFIEPTIIQTTDPKNKLMAEEIFGPVLTVYVYPDNQWEETLHLVDSTSIYALTGSMFARDRSVLEKASHILRQSAGNVYINDKSTGSVVGQQSFGGARQSGTNDKTGAMTYMLKWVSPQSIKETFLPITTWTYPSVDKE